MARRQAKRKQSKPTLPVKANARSVRLGFFKRKWVRYGVPIVVGLAISVAGTKLWHGQPTAKPAPTTIRQVTDFKKLNPPEFSRLAKKRVPVLNSLARQLSPAFNEAIRQKAATLFSSLNSLGKEQGGVIFFDQKNNRFEFQVIADENAAKMQGILWQLKQGDFTNTRVFADYISDWQSNDYNVINGKKTLINGAYLADSLQNYRIMWNQKQQLERQGQSTQVIDEKIRQFMPFFDYVNERVAGSIYDTGPVLMDYFAKDELFNEKTAKQFFCCFHSHPSHVFQGQTVERGAISPQDLQNTSDFGPMAVVQFGRGFNAIQFAIDGKIIFEQKFPQTNH